MENSLEITTKPHSKLGIGSFVLSIVSGIIIWSSIVAGVLEYLPDNDTTNLIIGICALLGMFLNVVGIGIGLGGVFQRDAKKLFSVMGIFFNISSIAIMIFMLTFA